MPETEKSQPSAEEKLREIESKTTFRRYFSGQFMKLAINAAGALAGMFAFKKLGESRWGEEISKFLTKTHSDIDPNARFRMTRDKFPLAGLLTGFVVSGFFTTYDSWKKREVENLAVGEINNDVARMMDERNKFAQTLNRQETLIKEIVEERQGNMEKPHAEKILEKPIESAMR